MKTSTRRAGFRHGETAPGASRRGAQVTRFRIDASVNDATHAVAPTLGEEARPWHMVPPTRSDVDATEAAYAAWPSSPHPVPGARGGGAPAVSGGRRGAPAPLSSTM